MSIIPCPSCGKRISSLAPICDHCGHHEGRAEKSDLKRFHARQLRKQIYRLNMATYAIMTAVIIAFAWHLVVTGGLETAATSRGPFYLMMASAVAYLVVRIMLFRAKQQRKEFRRSD